MVSVQVDMFLFSQVHTDTTTLKTEIEQQNENWWSLSKHLILDFFLCFFHSSINFFSQKRHINLSASFIFSFLNPYKNKKNE